MRVLFIYPSYYLLREIPLGISLLSAVLKREHHKVDLFDTTFMNVKREKIEDRMREIIDYHNYQFLKAPPIKEEIDELVNLEEELIRKIEDFKPDLIAFSITTELWNNAINLIKIIKKNYPKVPVLVGGVHPTIDPEGVIKEADMACVGEGEDMIVELCDKLEKGEDITEIKNLWGFKNNRIYKNDLRPLIDLDSLPCPDWSLFNKRHLIGIYRGKICNRAHYLTMRGCPYACSYCTNNYFKKLYKGKGKIVRWESVDKTVNNLKELKKDYDLDMIKFSDDLFLVRSVEELKYFRDEYKKDVNLPFLISVTPNMVTGEKIKIIQEAGCVHLSIGIESGNDKKRKEILNRNITNEQILNAFKIANKLGIRTSSFNMIGLPTETRRDVFKTIEMNRMAKVGTANVYYLYPFPKTEMRAYCEKQNMIPPDADSISIFEGEKFNLSKIPLKDLQGLRKTFILYMKMPKIYYPLIRICEYNNEYSNWLTKKLYEHMQKKYVD